jgi:hypothetical protein
MSQNTGLLFVKWMYLIVPGEIIRTTRNFLLWAWKMFSVGYLLKRLFSPWHRDITGYGRGFDLGRMFQAFVFNLVSRGVGAVLRLATITCGLAVGALIIVLGAITFLFWVLLPAIVFYLLIGAYIWTF